MIRVDFKITGDEGHVARYGTEYRQLDPGTNHLDAFIYLVSSLLNTVALDNGIPAYKMAGMVLRNLGNDAGYDLPQEHPLRGHAEHLAKALENLRPEQASQA